MAGPRHFLDLHHFDGAALRAMIEHAAKLKAAPDRRSKLLEGRTLAMIFERPSTRTRMSFDVAMRQMGGSVVNVSPSELQLGRGESVGDTARVLSRYVDAVMIRAARAETMETFAAAASIPVINGLTDKTHPCQVMADVMTFEERLGPIGGRAIAWTGDGNNVAVSWVHAAVRFGFELRLACPANFEPPASVIDWAHREGGNVRVMAEPEEAVRGASAVVTDTWVSMHHTDGHVRHNVFARYQVNDRLMAQAAKDAIFMHCLPAHRGYEVTDAVIDGPRSAVWDEAENRLHAQKAILAHCLA